MFEFIRRKFTGDGADSQASDGNGIVQMVPGGVVVMNLEKCWWVVETGGGGRQILPSASGHEVFSEEDHLKGIRAVFLRMGQESQEQRALQHALDSQTPLVIIFPSKPRVRGEVLQLLEEYLKRRLKVESTDFELFKLYTGPVRPGGEKFCRKFRGKRGEQVALNLSGEGLRYLHYDPDVKDVVLDALDSDWPVSPMSETLVELAERRIRGMDPAYFRRMRDGIAAGLLLVYLPEERAQRLPIFGTAGRLLDRAPGGGIDLDGPGVLRLHRTRPGLEQ